MLLIGVLWVCGAMFIVGIVFWLCVSIPYKIVSGQFNGNFVGIALIGLLVAVFSPFLAWVWSWYIVGLIILAAVCGAVSCLSGR